jgi:sulfatase maturation enzyme AslB (radical SAM superfamily)
MAREVLIWRKKYVAEPVKCRLPWEHLLVVTDGRTQNCCYQGQSLGNLEEQTLEEIWNGEKINEVRESLTNGIIPELCKGEYPCIYQGRQ